MTTERKPTEAEVRDALAFLEALAACKAVSSAALAAVQFLGQVAADERATPRQRMDAARLLVERVPPAVMARLGLPDPTAGATR